jgi:hypothetical protein
MSGDEHGEEAAGRRSELRGGEGELEGEVEVGEGAEGTGKDTVGREGTAGERVWWEAAW